VIFLKINDIVIAPPKEIAYSYENLNKEERSLDGTLLIDIISKKLMLNITWEYLKDSDMKIIENEINESKFVKLEYLDNLTSKLVEIEGSAGEFSYQPYYDWANDRLMWKSVSLTFKEK
jgi:hypothetical protein